MKLKGNIHDIRNKRDNSNSGIEILIDKVEYVTHKKDGRFYQPFDFTVELETPFVLTGDCLARVAGKAKEADEIQFQVFDKTGDEYVLNPDKQLEVTMAYDEEEDLHILTFFNYSVTVSNEDFNNIKSEYSKLKKQKKGRK